MFHFRQRYALEIGETVVNGLRADIFAKMQRQPMSFFHRMKLGRIISRVTSDVEAVRVGDPGRGLRERDPVRADGLHGRRAARGGTG